MRPGPGSTEAEEFPSVAQAFNVEAGENGSLVAGEWLVNSWLVVAWWLVSWFMVGVSVGLRWRNQHIGEGGCKWEAPLCVVIHGGFPSMVSATIGGASLVGN